MVIALLSALMLLSLGTTRTLSVWSAAQLANSSNSARTGSLVYTHAYPESCTAGPRAAAVTCSGSPASTVGASDAAATVSDTITNQSDYPAGTPFHAQVRMESCAPVAFANRRAPNNPQLPRYAVGFQADDPWGGTNAVTTMGTGGLTAASAATAGVPDTLLSLGGTVGWGIWFKTTTTAGGPIFSLNSTPAYGGTAPDKVLYMNKAGKVGFVYSTTPATTALSSASYNDGEWHFAYVRLQVTSLAGISVTSTAVVRVDNQQVASGNTLLGGSLASGYWHVGWAPINAETYGTGLSNHWLGSVSNLAVFYGSVVPSSSGPNATSQTAYDTFADTATQHWQFGDSGVSTYSGNIGYISGGDACTEDTLGWTLGANTAVAATTTLRSMVGLGWTPAVAVAAPTPGASQTGVTSYRRVASGYDLDVAGLHLYAPLSYRVGTARPPTTGWTITFRWADDPAGVFIA
ncbi:hypothetical protein [Nocardioides sp. LML1-1-1.1]|uniref:hypothetical protein n=1 Tax=Nocardioides sp. LML1-1-1.1 TaxID=3135248 RepID=UPI003413F70B